VSLPVISVGNLTVGGTGKTPMVALLAQMLTAWGGRVAIISRGYRAILDGKNDEALELDSRLPGILHIQQPNRVRAARMIEHARSADVILLDDGFQHRRLHRDLDIVLIDALRPDGFGHLLPRGLLREPLQQIRRAHVVVLTRSDAVTDVRRLQIKQKIMSMAGGALWLEVTEQTRSLVNRHGWEQPLSEIVQQPVAAFCGIGNPEGFRHTLTRTRASILGFQVFPDHHAYPRSDLDRLERWLSSLPPVRAVICTQKDLTKIARTQLAGYPLWSLNVETAIVTGSDVFCSLLRSIAFKPQST
jgi:tetraacyldisaccharide 4'-kinase